MRFPCKAGLTRKRQGLNSQACEAVLQESTGRKEAWEQETALGRVACSSLIRADSLLHSLLQIPPFVEKGRPLRSRIEKGKGTRLPRRPRGGTVLASSRPTRLPFARAEADLGTSRTQGERAVVEPQQTLQAPPCIPSAETPRSCQRRPSFSADALRLGCPPSQLSTRSFFVPQQGHHSATRTTTPDELHNRTSSAATAAKQQQRHAHHDPLLPPPLPNLGSRPPPLLRLLLLPLRPRPPPHLRPPPRLPSSPSSAPPALQHVRLSPRSYKGEVRRC